MIPRITRGSSARSALAYDFGPGRREEHENPRTVAGNVPGDWREQADTIDETVAAKPRVSKGIHRTSLRAAPEDRTLSDEEWGQIAQRYVQEMGVEDHPWTATRHGDDHIHLTVSRVSWEGEVQPLHRDFPKAQAACRQIEREHDLVDASQRYDRARPQVSHGERERSERLGQPSEREQLRGHIDASAAVAARSGQDGEVDPRTSRERFEEALSERGVSFRRNEASTGRVSGYSYGLDDHRDARGEQVFYKGSDLGKDYRWGAVQERLNERQGTEQTRAGSGGTVRSGDALARVREQESARGTRQMPGSRREPSAGSSGKRGQGMSRQSERQQKGSERAQESLGRMREQEAARGGGQEREKAPRERSQAAQDRDDLKYEQQRGEERLREAARAEGKDLYEGPGGRGGGSPEERLATHHEMHLQAVEHHRHIQEDEKRRQQRLEQSRGHER